MNYTIETTFLICIAIIVYIVAVDKNVEDYLILLLKICRVNIMRFMWIIRFHPKNPITNYIKHREFKKIAKQLELELSNNNDD